MDTSSPGRARQRQRTRTALLDSAVTLIKEGATPTIADVAEHAGISRATAYRYFPSQDLMLVEAALHGAVPDIPGALATSDAGDDPERRLAIVVDLVNRWVTEREPGFRAFLRQSLDPAASDPNASGDDHLPGRRRGGRRIGWLEEALAPIRDDLPPDRFRNLVAALSFFTGIETKIVLHDIWELDEAEAGAVIAWATTALLRQALAGTGTAP